MRPIEKPRYMPIFTERDVKDLEYLLANTVLSELPEKPSERTIRSLAVIDKVRVHAQYVAIAPLDQKVLARLRVWRERFRV